MKTFCLPVWICLSALWLASCGGPVTEEVSMPTLPAYASASDELITLRKDDLEVVLTPTLGGRISALHFHGEPVIIAAADTPNPNGWGNVFWPSPQSMWGWPPLAALDSDAYQLDVQDDRIILTSAREPRTHLVVEKHYDFIAADNVLRILYRVSNVGKKELTLAPWEITRVPPAGLAFFPRGETTFYAGDFAALPVTEAEGIVWYAMGDAEAHGPQNHKLMTHGREGWLAWLRGNTLLVKTFTDVPAELMAPNEGEIEIYSDASHTYVELEQQGILTTLQPGESLDWTVHWVFAQVEADLHHSPQALVQQARALAAKAPGR